VHPPDPILILPPSQFLHSISSPSFGGVFGLCQKTRCMSPRGERFFDPEDDGNCTTGEGFMTSRESHLSWASGACLAPIERLSVVRPSRMHAHAYATHTCRYAHEGLHMHPLQDHARLQKNCDRASQRQIVTEHHESAGVGCIVYWNSCWVAPAAGASSLFLTATPLLRLDWARNNPL